MYILNNILLAHSDFLNCATRDPSASIGIVKHDTAPQHILNIKTVLPHSCLLAVKENLTEFTRDISNVACARVLGIATVALNLNTRGVVVTTSRGTVALRCYWIVVDAHLVPFQRSAIQ